MFARFAAWWRRRPLWMRIVLVVVLLPLAFVALNFAWVIFAFWRNPVAH